MDKSASAQLMYYIGDVVDNAINIKGLRILGKAHWPILTNIYHSLFSHAFFFERADVKKTKVFFDQKITL